MSIERVGFVGWRGMVGSVLLERMQAEGDFVGLTPRFYSTSNPGGTAPNVGVEAPPLVDAYDVSALSEEQAVLCCQGSAYTKRVLPELRAAGWKGLWIDASSAKRMDADTVIPLDPINRAQIDDALAGGTTNYFGGNCTVSLMLLALHGLFREDLVEWMTSMTYQAASGAGAKNMRELVAQMGAIGEAGGVVMSDPTRGILDLDKAVLDTMNGPDMPTEHFGGVPLAGSLLPWIDSAMPDGDTREEWKGWAEGNKILGRRGDLIPMDSICVRIAAMRCHSQAYTIKLRRDVPLPDIEAMLSEANDWVRFVPNDKERTIRELTPARATGTLEIPVGRVRKLRMGDTFLGAFSVGDQLLWGAAEPLRRMLAIARAH